MFPPNKSPGPVSLGTATSESAKEIILDEAVTGFIMIQQQPCTFMETLQSDGSNHREDYQGNLSSQDVANHNTTLISRFYECHQSHQQFICWFAHQERGLCTQVVKRKAKFRIGNLSPRLAIFCRLGCQIGSWQAIPFRMSLSGCIPDAKFQGIAICEEYFEGLADNGGVQNGFREQMISQSLIPQEKAKGRDGLDP
ncbi:predicted protein [Histoplasma capsulatum G186AR]|uniref:Uncharacterized protein n=1 Tax=Ajellomyces capsulatus (strain G186AR / H82 / ATCC MYA-2454 / RMSCC 2432) TaxID=447093 RepID=C0NV04_AJECG|nr:uncharacterized protein HCBG_06768 [Histoplasma capsulatum G186AR]EEH04817.1 predicted protein [Histoplasma capsulatum G186AR]